MMSASMTRAVVAAAAGLLCLLLLRRTRTGPGNPALAAPAMVVRRGLRHLRQGGDAARLSGLQADLLGLPSGQAPLFPRSGGARLHPGPGQGDRRQRPGHRRTERPGPDVSAARPPVRPDPRPVSERRGGARGKRRRVAARSVDDRQGARRRPRLRLRDPERLQARRRRASRCRRANITTSISPGI